MDACEVETKALAFNAERCLPSLPESEVVRTVRSACRYPIRRVKATEEVREVVARLWGRWEEEALPGGGRSKLRDAERVGLEFAVRHGRVVEIVDGETGEVLRGVAMSISARDGSGPAACSHMTFARSMRRLVEFGRVRKVDEEERAEQHSTTWAFIGSATKPLHPSIKSSLKHARGVTLRRGGVEPLQTPCFRWGSPVRNTGGGVLVAVEIWGPQTADELAGRVGWSRERDLKARHLDRLVEDGVLAENGGVYSLPDDYAAHVQSARRVPYGGRERKVHRRTSEGRTVCYTVESEPASEEARERRDAARHERQRRAFRTELEIRKTRSRFGRRDAENAPETATEQDAVDVADFLNLWDEEADPAPEHHRPTPLAGALRSYWDANPRDAGQPAYWLAITLWAYGLYPEKPPREEVADALVEALGGQVASPELFGHQEVERLLDNARSLVTETATRLAGAKP